MRPKSIATVVVFLNGVPLSSSTPTDSSVMIASVRSGMISETAPTKVVLPAPNPPAITILVDATVRVLERAEATQRPSDQLPALFHRRAVIKGREHPQMPGPHHIGHQNPRDTEGHVEPGRDLCHRRSGGAQRHDVTSHVVGKPLVIPRGLVRLDRRLQRQLYAR